MATLAGILGILWGIHALLALQIGLHQFGVVESLSQVATLIGPDRMRMLLQWCTYVVVVCTFHFAEFLVTAVCNPTVTSSDSFLINHSIAYTAAALVRSGALCCEFEGAFCSSTVFFSSRSSW